MTEAELVSYELFLSERRDHLRSLVADAARRAGRDSREVELLAVSKTVGPDELACAWRCGYRLFGENRPQELVRKWRAVEANPELADVTLEMIGNLQTNKINHIIDVADRIQSVSSLHLARAIAKRAQPRGITVRALLEVNVSGEQSKSGFAPEDLRRGLDELLDLPCLQFEGLMAMAPAGDQAAARATFAGLRELRDELRMRSGRDLEVLSCGMSDDFCIAVEEGSTLIRLGRIVFDPSYDLGAYES